jgi:hypothetical protein
MLHYWKKKNKKKQIRNIEGERERGSEEVEREGEREERKGGKKTWEEGRRREGIPDQNSRGVHKTSALAVTGLGEGRAVPLVDLIRNLGECHICDEFCPRTFYHKYVVQIWKE